MWRYPHFDSEALDRDAPSIGSEFQLFLPSLVVPEHILNNKQVPQRILNSFAIGLNEMVCIQRAKDGGNYLGVGEPLYCKLTYIPN